MDFFAQASILKDMINDDEIDPVKVRTGLFALITARLEDAHEVAVKGQLHRAEFVSVNECVNGIQSSNAEIQILLLAAQLINH